MRPKTTRALSARQVDVLTLMAQGHVLATHNGEHYIANTGRDIYPATTRSLLDRGCIELTREHRTGAVFTITPAGRAALDVARRGEGAIVRSEKNRDRMRRCPAPDGSPTRFYTRH